MISKKAPEILATYRKIVWPKIQEYIKNPDYPKAFKIPKKYQEDANLHWKITSEYPQRQGKYLRPTLLLLIVKAFGANYKMAINTSAAMQISEDWLLIHDDIEDNSNMRRGKPALHKIYGIESAINAGDALHTIMWRVLIENFKVLSPDTAIKILKEFHTMLTRTIVGQGVEINWSKSNNFTFNDNDSFFIMDGKSSYYTIAGPMRLGGIISGVSDKELNLLTRLGLILGRCFQLTDDLLDLEEKEYRGKGQVIGNDIFESKKTVMLGHLLRNIGSKYKKRLITILQKDASRKTTNEVRWVIDKMHHHGSIKYGKQIAQDLKEKSLTIFKTKTGFLKKKPEREDIETLIRFISERDH